MPFNWIRGLRARLLGFFVLSLVIPTVITSVVATMTARRSLLESIFREQRELARRISDRVSVHVGHVKTVLLNEASREEFNNNSSPKQYATLRQIIENYPYLMDCAVLNSDGREVVKAVRQGDQIVPSSALANRANREEFRLPRGGFNYVGPVFFTQRDRIPQMFVSVPMGKTGKILLARLSLDGIWDLISEVAVGKTGYAYVIDSKGNLIAHPQKQRVLSHENLADRTVVREFLKGENETLGAPNSSFHSHEGDLGEETLAVHHRVHGLDWGVIVQTPLREALVSVRDLRRRVLFIVLGFAALFLLVGLSLVKRILEPLRKLQGGAEKIGQGDLKHRLDIRTGDEIQHLAEAFNSMAGSLHAFEQAKRDLTHMVVHDLKSPLSGVLGCIDYVASGSIGPLTPEQKKILSLGSKSGRDLLRLIQNLLDIAKMEEGRLEIKRDNFSLLDLVAECLDDMDASMRREQKVVSVDIGRDMPHIYADRDLIYRVLQNLLSNALRHTSAGAEISIRARLHEEDGSALVFSVRDSGEGIPPEFLDKIFEKFEQADVNKKRFRMGTGLGLTFCKMAIEAHGGHIWVESEVGRGSEFFVRIPLLKAPPEPTPAVLPAAATVLTN